MSLLIRLQQHELLKPFLCCYFAAGANETCWEVSVKNITETHHLLNVTYECQWGTLRMAFLILFQLIQK